MGHLRNVKLVSALGLALAVTHCSKQPEAAKPSTTTPKQSNLDNATDATDDSADAKKKTTTATQKSLSKLSENDQSEVIPSDPVPTSTATSMATATSTANQANPAPVSPSPPPPPPATCGRMLMGNSLMPGQSLVSCDGTSQAVFQTDGNFVVYHNGVAKWSTKTYNKPANLVTLQVDGNLVVYQSGKALWNSNTFRAGGSFVLVMQDDTNLVIMDATGPIWSWMTGKIR